MQNTKVRTITFYGKQASCATGESTSSKNVPHLSYSFTQSNDRGAQLLLFSIFCGRRWVKQREKQHVNRIWFPSCCYLTPSLAHVLAGFEVGEPALNDNRETWQGSCRMRIWHREPCDSPEWWVVKYMEIVLYDLVKSHHFPNTTTRRE